jgi:hypothetical protein
MICSAFFWWFKREEDLVRTGYSCEISGRRHSYGSYRNALVGDKGHEFIKLQSVQEGSELEARKGRGSSQNQVDQTFIKKPQL